jgi:HEPN domain-containing protein
VNFYDNATEVYLAAKSLCENGHYRMSICNSCLSIELFLKSRLHLVDRREEYEFSHDVINIYRDLQKRFPSKMDLTKVISLGRKYFNESRYPHGDTTAYTEAFAQEFLEHVANVRSYIDDECNADIGDLKNKFQK